MVDPDGEDPTLPARMAIGAAISGAISGTTAVIQGKSFTEVIAATAGGAVDGAIGAVGGTTTKLVSGLFSGGAGSWVEQKLNVAFGNQEVVDFSGVRAAAVIGSVSNGVSESVAKGLNSIAEEVIGSSSARKVI